MRQKKITRRELLRNFLFKRTEYSAKRKSYLKIQFDKGGIPFSPQGLQKVFYGLTVVMNLYMMFYMFKNYIIGPAYIIIFPIMWVVITVAGNFLLWLVFHLINDLRIYRRTKKLEEVLPDFLQLASSNIRAGMTVDQALWFAIRPRFGVLANEIGDVAKRTYAGEPLELALEALVNKYESKNLERSVNLIIEGIRSGGEVGELMNKISLNIQEQNIMKKEMAANVTTYVIFISFATAVAAPFLFALALNLVDVIQQVFSKINIAPGAATGVPLQITGGVISTGDFQKFGFLQLIITSLFSGMIVSTIKKGNVKSGIKYIPMFILISITLFLIMTKVFNIFISGFF